MNSHNVCQGGLNPNPFVGFSPPQQTLYIKSHFCATTPLLRKSANPHTYAGIRLANRKISTGTPPPHPGGLIPTFLRIAEKPYLSSSISQKRRIKPTWVKAWVSVGILWICLKNTGIVAWGRRFYRKKSNGLKMNFHNVYRGGLNPNPFAGFSPPQHTLYKSIFARLLLFCENQQIHILTRVSGLQTKKYPRKRHPLTQVG